MHVLFQKKITLFVLNIKHNMKKIIFTCLLGISALVLLESFGTIQLGKKDGTEPGYTGSPGDSLKNCTVCHGGSAYPVANWITSNIPSSGYVPGNTYTITATNYGIGHTRFGFSISPQAINGDLLGKLLLTDTVTTKLVGNDKYITYTAAGVESLDSMVWKFDWTAPEAGKGDVVFYGAFNSNQNGEKGGDVTYLSTLRVKETGTASIQTQDNKTIHVQIFPNPCSDYLNINFNNNISGQQTTVNLVDLSGKQHYNLLNEKWNNQVFTQKLDIKNIPNGVYILSVSVGNKTKNIRLNILH
jgi:hypothetical protein